MRHFFDQDSRTPVRLSGHLAFHHPQTSKADQHMTMRGRPIRSAAIARRGACGADQGADRRIADLRRLHAILKRQALAAGLKRANHKRIYRVMKAHGLLLDRHAGGVERRHDGRIAVDERNRRWCSDGFEIGCDNGEGAGCVLRSIAVTGKP
jgi:hypothetical protein